jgi:regulator of cell morphogenesis and NO signaling
VASFVEAYPSSAATLLRMGIDFAGQGDRPLNSVCAGLGLDPEVVMRVVATGGTPGPETANDWHALANSALAEYIVATHHRFLRRELPRLHALLDAAVRTEGRGHPELRKLDEVFAELHREIDEHLRKEEEILFPAIRSIDQGEMPPLRGPLIVMLEEHYHAGDALRKMRCLTDGYAAPLGASRSLRTLLKGLEALEFDLALHIHKENNVLFPRVFAATDRLKAAVPA